MDGEEDEKPQLLLGDFCLYDKHGHLGEHYSVKLFYLIDFLYQSNKKLNKKQKLFPLSFNPKTQ